MNQPAYFRFQKFDDHLLSSLNDSYLYFSSPDSLNDPFDCRVDILKAIDNAITKCSMKAKSLLIKLRQKPRLFQKLQCDIAQVGILSCTNSMLNTVMWSHYADEHQGVCLLYYFPDNYFYQNKDKILGRAPVEYGVNPLTDWFIHQSQIPQSFEAFTESLIERILTIKSAPWKYEQEVRIVSKSPGKHRIPAEYLRQICFGLRASEDHVKEVRRILNNQHYDGLTVCKMARSDDSDFGLKPEEL